MVNTCFAYMCLYSFIGRLFRHALQDSRPNSVLVYSLCVCISLLDPKRLTLGTYYMYNRQLTYGPTITTNPETVEGMLENLGKVTLNIYLMFCLYSSTNSTGYFVQLSHPNTIPLVRPHYLHLESRQTRS